MTEKIWEYKNKTLTRAEISAFAELCKIPPLAALLLLNRGVNTPEKAKKYIRKSLDAVHDPFLLNDMDKCAERIVSAIEKKEKITVYGDYDVDGITSTALLVRFLRDRGANVSYYVPNREKEGYGVNVMAINKIAKSGTKLLITVDCGITSVGEVELAKTLGTEVIITDHHLCKEKLPAALAVVDPKRPDSQYPFPALAGVGVAFKTALAVAKLLGEKTSDCFFKYVELAAVGTIADVVDLLGENRVIVQKGLELMKNSAYPGIRALLKSSGAAARTVGSTSVAFMLAPRINAIGRMADAQKAVELMLTDDDGEADALAAELESANSQRRSAEREIYEEALEMIENDEEASNKNVIVLAKENWHHGVIGIVASRITEQFYKPSILLSIDKNGKCKGSGRSIEGFNLFEALTDSAELLTAFGGHGAAAGLSLSKEALGDFSARINNYAKKTLKKSDMIPKLSIDCEISPAALTVGGVKMLEFIEPFGEANPKPVFSISNAVVKKIDLIGENKNHVRMTIEKNGASFNAVGFKMEQIAREKRPGDLISCAFSPEINRFRGEESIQLMIKDVK